MGTTSSSIYQIGCKAGSSSDNPDLIFYGIAFGLEKIADYRIYKLHSDKRLNKLNDQISAINQLEDLDDLESFKLCDPNTPEDYQALNIEFEYRLDEMRLDITKEFSEVEMADLFWSSGKEYYGKYQRKIIQKC